MHEAGAPHPSFTHSHSGEWQQIENEPLGVCRAQSELRQVCVWVIFL